MNAPTPAMAPLPADFPNPVSSPGEGWRAALELGFERREQRTVLARNRHHGPLRVQKALYPEGEAVCHAIVVHPPAGIVGGDQLALDITVGEGAHALLTTPGAGKWYRSGGRPARMTQDLRIGPGACCEFLPQESLIYDGAEGELHTRVSLAPGARFIGSELLCFGRRASGEHFRSGAFGVHTRIEREGRVLWLERGRLLGDDPVFASPAGFDGAAVCATLLAVADEVDETLRDACREVPPQRGVGALSLLPGVLVARWRGDSCEAGREWFAALWQVLRPALAGRAAEAPRIWST